MSKIKIKSVHYFLILLVTILIAFIIRGCIIEKEINKEGKVIIVKFIKKERFPKTTDFTFGYYHKGKYIETANAGVNYSILNSDEETKLIDSIEINSYYQAKILDNHPEIIIVDPSKKITDSIAIKSAGFIKSTQ